MYRRESKKQRGVIFPIGENLWAVHGRMFTREFHQITAKSGKKNLNTMRSYNLEKGEEEQKVVATGEETKED